MKKSTPLLIAEWGAKEWVALYRLERDKYRVEHFYEVETNCDTLDFWEFSGYTWANQLYKDKFISICSKLGNPQ